MCCCHSKFNTKRKYWSGKFTCVIVCLPLQQTDDYKKYVRTILGVVEMFMCTEINKESNVVERRFDCPLCWSPVQESTAVLRMH